MTKNERRLEERKLYDEHKRRLTQIGLDLSRGSQVRFNAPEQQQVELLEFARMNGLSHTEAGRILVYLGLCNVEKSCEEGFKPYAKQPTFPSRRLAVLREEHRYAEELEKLRKEEAEKNSPF